MTFPQELMYSTSHEWMKTLEDGAVQVGITDFAQDSLGDLVFVGLPQVGDEVEAGGALADVESVKAVSDIYSPVTGVIKAVNEELLDAPELINQSPYAAWLAEIADVTSTKEMMNATEYEAFCKQEG